MATEHEAFETLVDVVPGIGTGLKVYFALVNFGRKDKIEYRVEELEKQVRALQALVDDLIMRINKIELLVAREGNLARLDRLKSRTNAAKGHLNELMSEDLQPRDRKRIAYDAGLNADRFIEEDSLWEWFDIKTTTTIEDDGRKLPPRVEAVLADFKVWPALPCYFAVAATWILAVAQECGGSRELVRSRHGARIQAHIAKATVRPGFDEFRVAALSLPEKIMTKITCSPVPQTRYARNGRCEFSIQAENAMDRKRFHVRDVTIGGYDDGASCTVDSTIGQLDERQLEDEHGVAPLADLAAALERLLSTASPLAAEPFQGRFGPTPFNVFSFVYAVDANGDLHWFRQKPSAIGGQLAGWQEPRVVGHGWEAFRSIVPAGGNRLYGWNGDGSLTWFRHEGFVDGEYRWNGPTDVGHPIDPGSRLVGAGDGVIYEIRPDGTMHWHRHVGFEHGEGPQSWQGPRQVGHGWHFRSVVAAGEGVMYAIDDDGALLWYKHTAWQTGATAWQGPVSVGTGLGSFGHVVSVGHGVLYAIRADGSMVWFQHRGWLTGETVYANPRKKGGGGVVVLDPPLEPALAGPIEAGNGWNGFTMITGLVPARPGGVG